MVPNKSFERDVCYATAPHTPLKLGVMGTQMNKNEVIEKLQSFKEWPTGEVAKEMKSVGYSVDFNKIVGSSPSAETRRVNASCLPTA